MGKTLQNIIFNQRKLESDTETVHYVKDIVSVTMFVIVFFNYQNLLFNALLTFHELFPSSV